MKKLEITEKKNVYVKLSHTGYRYIGATVTSLLANLFPVPEDFIIALMHGLLFAPFLKLSIFDVITQSPLDKIHVLLLRSF